MPPLHIHQVKCVQAFSVLFVLLCYLCFVTFHVIQLCICTRLSEVERDKVVPLILEGFREAATEAGSSVSGGIQG